MKDREIFELIDERFYLGIAHRGLHNENDTENSLKAFKNAIEADVAFEFDIHLTKDNKLVVCHDEDLKRTTGKEGIIEDLTLEEIKKDFKLLNGEEVPTLEEVLALNNERVPMVIEFKVFRKNYKELAKYAKEVLETIKDKSKVMLISFDPRSLWPFKKSGFVRSLLLWHGDFYTYMFRHSVESLDVEDVLTKRRKVQRYSMNHFVNVWTITSFEQMEKVLPYVDTVTFQYMDPKKVQKILRRHNSLD